MHSRRTVSGWLVVLMIAGQLAILWIKEQREQGSALVRAHEFFGYAPNLVAALTLPCLFLGLSLKSRRGRMDEPYGWVRLWREDAAILKSLLGTVAGLLAWEFVQIHRPNRTFDWQDMWATLAGGGLFFAIVLAGRGLSACRALATFAPATRQEHEIP
jgi:hypothetical protein